jgi:hypothetical protein
MKRTLVLALAASLLVGGALWAKTKSDRDTLLGTWAVSQGVYADGSLENELEMQFTFTAATMTNPMSESEIAYTLDEKARTITATDKDATVTIQYKVVDQATLQFVAMSVKNAKGLTQIVGDKGTFKQLTLKKKA